MENSNISAVQCVFNRLGKMKYYSEDLLALMSRIAMAKTLTMPVTRMRTRDGYLGVFPFVDGSFFNWKEHELDTAEIFVRDNNEVPLVYVPKFENSIEYYEDYICNPKWLDESWVLLDDDHRYYSQLIESGRVPVGVLMVITGFSLNEIKNKISNALDHKDEFPNKILLDSVWCVNHDWDRFSNWEVDLQGFFTYLIVVELSKCGLHNRLIDGY